MSRTYYESLAKEHWRGFLPKRWKALTKEGTLEQELELAAELTDREMQAALAAGVPRNRAWEEIRGRYLLLEPEPLSREAEDQQYGSNQNREALDLASEVIEAIQSDACSQGLCAVRTRNSTRLLTSSTGAEGSVSTRGQVEHLLGVYEKLIRLWRLLLARKSGSTKGDSKRELGARQVNPRRLYQFAAAFGAGLPASFLNHRFPSSRHQRRHSQ